MARVRRTFGVLGGTTALGALSQSARFEARSSTDDSDVAFRMLDTRSPCLVDYTAVESGKIAHYVLKWINTRSVLGPWSESASATMGAYDGEWRS